MILLDAGPLSLISHPRGNDEAVRCAEWVRDLRAHGQRVVIPEIADYEVRRELHRANKLASLQKLDGLQAFLDYAPITTAVMHQAAVFWAQARQQGQPTAPDLALDADVILAAQSAELERGGLTTVVATTNPRHLARFVDARLWSEIPVTG